MMKGPSAATFKGAPMSLDHKPLPLPELPVSSVPSRSKNNSGTSDADDEDALVHEFTRNDLRELIHLITQELKLKGTKTPLLLLSFRPKSVDTDLTAFLEVVLPTGKKLANTATLQQKVKKTDEFTLTSALKYLWARLPTNSIIGWDAYESFKNLEQKQKYPKKAFLEFMPQCLSSPSHASIVYDFLDLIVSIAANSKENQMSGRKIAKMAAIWAFQGNPPNAKTPNNSEYNFVDGLQNWLPASDAMFHLLLSFLRSMLPDDDSTKLQLPRTLHALLASNSYPPPDVTYTSSSLVTVPLIAIKTNKLSSTPIELLNKVPKFLSFEDKNQFQAKEDYALLKSFCKNDENIINKLSDESKRIIKSLTQVNKQTRLKPGWSLQNQPNIPLNQVETDVEISRVPIDDYFIWAWLSSISFEQPSLKKKTFGRSLILEVVFDGFKKWVIIEEVSLNFKSQNSLPGKPIVRKTIQPKYTSMLDDIPVGSNDNKPALKKSKAVKSQELPPNPKPKSNDKGKYSHGLLKKFSANKETQALPPPPISQTTPKPYSKEHQYESNISYDPVSLPEIEREQYRLSIPLDRFDIGDSPTRPYDKSPQQYKSLAPPSREEVYSQNLQNLQQFTQQYNYWSSQEPQPTRNNYDDVQYVNGLSDVPNQTYPNHEETYQQQQNHSQQEYQEHPIPLPDHHTHRDYYKPPSNKRFSYANGSSGSIENLNNMVDELSLQVNNVESKLGKDETNYYNRPVVEPQPRKLQEPINVVPSPAPVVNHQSLSRPASKIYEPVASPQQNHKSPPSSHLKPVLSPIRTTEAPQSLISKPKRKAPGDSRLASPTPTDFDPLESSIYASSSVYGPVPTEIEDDDYSRPVYNRNSMIDDVETYLANTKTNRETVFSEASYSTVIADVPQDVEIDETKRYSVDSVESAKYPESIIDTYRQPSIYHSKNKPSPAKTEIIDDEQGDLSATDIDYIPDATLTLEEELSIPVPSPPRSPLAKSNSPKCIHADLPPPPPPKIMLQELTQPNLPPPSNSQFQNQEIVSSESAPAVVSKDGYYKTPAPSFSSIPKELPQTDVVGNNNLTPSSSHTTPQGQRYTRKSPQSSTIQQQYVSTPPQQQQNSPHPILISPELLQPQQQQQNSPNPMHGKSPQQQQQQQQNQFTRKSPSPSSNSQNSYDPTSAPTSRLDPQYYQQEIQQRPSPSGNYHSQRSPNHMQRDNRSPQRYEGNGQYLQAGQQQQQHMAKTHSPNSSVNSRQNSPYRQQGYPYMPQHRKGGSPASSSTSSIPLQLGSTPQRDHRGRSPSNRPSSQSPSRGPKGNYPPQGYYPPPQGYYPPQQQGYPSQGYPPPPLQGYPPQGYPPQGYPPQGYPPQGYPPQGYPPQGYPPNGHPWYPPPPHGYYPPNGAAAQGSSPQKSTTSDVTLNSLPTTTTAMNKLHYRPNTDKKNIRNALVQGDFGI